jgi:acetyltransferase-like isoleucine patch superfamily enzyme
MSKVKEFFWRMTSDWSELYMRVLLWLPLRMGIVARQIFLPRMLGGMGKNTEIQPGLRIGSPKKLFIGANCHVAESAYITAGGTVRIGDWVGIGPGAKIWSVNHRFSDPDVPFITQGWDYKEVIIENDVWVGANTFVMPGVRIGTGAVISAGTVLLKSVPPFAIMAGNPGRVIGWRRKMEDQPAIAADSTQKNTP